MQDSVIMKGNWTFNEEVALCFDDMLQRSIPNYDVMRDLIIKLGKQYVDKSINIIDLGCSNGEGIAPFVHQFGSLQDYYLVDNSEPMLDVCRERYEELIKYGLMNVKNMDLRYEFPNVKAGLILSILTLQFIPIEYRSLIMKRIYDHLKPGGAFIFVEKTIGKCAETNKLITDEYLNLKHNNGYTKDQINNKRNSLEGVLVPLTVEWNEDMLKTAGFNKIETFWKHLNFTGWIAIK